jgi:hypothetical protein
MVSGSSGDRAGYKTFDRFINSLDRRQFGQCSHWLNDASKTSPDWVVDYCAQWREQTESPATLYITRKALRSLSKVPIK